MKALGIVRRIDDLGRVVIPKEIRRSLKIREGDALEIYLDNDVVCFKKIEMEKNFIEDVRKMSEDISELLYSWDNREELTEISQSFETILAQLNKIKYKKEEY